MTLAICIGVLVLGGLIAAVHERGQAFTFWTGLAIFASSAAALAFVATGQILAAVVTAAPGIALGIRLEKAEKAQVQAPAPAPTED